ncbi:MAG: sodium:proton antiporter [bacterium]
MEIVLAITIGTLYTAAVYMFLRRSIFKLILGILLMSHATNLLLFVSGKMSLFGLPFIKDEGTVSHQMTDPLPQALVLTAIVIGFGFVVYALVLVFRFHKETGTVDLDEITEELE